MTAPATDVRRAARPPNTDEPRSGARLKNGTLIEILFSGTRITLPDGSVVEGAPENNARYRRTAERLGYGADTLAMCRDHDPLHATLCDWLGIPSEALREAAGLPADKTIAILEEAAVLAIQKLLRAVANRAEPHQESLPLGKPTAVEPEQLGGLV